MSDDNRITKPTADEINATIIAVLRKFDPAPHRKFEIDEADEYDEEAQQQEYDVGGVTIDLAACIGQAIKNQLGIESTRSNVMTPTKIFSTLMGPPQIVDTPEGQFVQLPT